MYAYDDIRQVHLEITDKCNAACPQCPRSDHGGPINPSLPLTELTLSEITTFLPPDLVRQLNHVYLCGNYGDPIVARDCLAILEYLRASHPDITLGLHTNGGARSSDFWRALGHLVPKGKGYVRFGIDGLDDTNHVYRRHVRWPVLMRNVEALIAAGGNAEWNYLVFRHNEHQVEQARQLAGALGFSLFNVKKTGRFVDYRTMTARDATQIKERDGVVVGWLERPVEPVHQNRALDRLKDLERRHGSMRRYLDAARIDCKAQEERSLYVSSEGYVLPCCWLAGNLHNPPGRARTQFLEMLERLGGTERIDAHRRSLRTIVEDEFFQRLLPESWAKESCAAGKLRTCARICGRDFDRRRAQNSARARADAAAPDGDAARLRPTPTGRPAERLRLARRYRDGDGVEASFEAALGHYLSALDEAASPALQYEVGELYRTGGPGLPKDETVAAAWYRRAAEGGSRWAQYRLGEAHRTGRGVAPDRDEAARFYEMAAIAGHPWAQYWLGESYRTGRGRPLDPEAARTWLSRSAAQGNRRAILALERRPEGSGDADRRPARGDPLS